ncbi:MAG TPA: zinc ribbon domain-containing protein [Pyrinomonadaceae bacterium]|nr:zinc ribbon domain-containing protein [Pyrinomonadaceae bacterium]
MPEPVIARRCPTCGASIRQVALFCPQCGNALPPRAADQSQSAAAIAEEENRRDTAPLDNSAIRLQPDFSDTVAIKRADVQDGLTSMSDTLAIDMAIEKPKELVIDPASPRVRETVGAKVQRATTMARGVEGDVMQRVQKVREISTVVIDEAAYDPSLRFILVAAFVFGLFLIIVVLNKFIS